MTRSGPSEVRVSGVWKQFRRGARHDSLRDLIPALVRGAVRAAAGRAPGDEAEAFWALRDVSFAVRPGEVMGIIGPNGAGKSTMLKLLTRILRPTRGTVEVTGRVGALIELAAGFHPDLTGRENVFLQGAIMGMRRAEIRAKFEEIVEFSGVAPFLDTPVKRYSSGMNARLGFAVAAHLDPDVLLIDEVLSVGDFPFQRKATTRLQEIVKRGIPVVIVSHQLDRVATLCNHAALLVGGRVVKAGAPDACIAAYTSGDFGPTPESSGSPVRLTALTCEGDGTVSGGRVILRLQGNVERPAALPEAAVGIRVRSLSDQALLFATNATACGVELPREGPFTLEIGLEMNVGPGAYAVQGVVWRRSERLEWVPGPTLVVRVDRAPHAFGEVYLRPSMRLADS